MQVSQRRSLLIITDIILVNLAALVALWLGAERSNWHFTLEFVATRFYWFLVPTIGFVLLATVNDAYDLRVASERGAVAWALVRVTVQMLLAYLVVYFISPRGSLPRHIIGFFSLILPVALLSWRWLYITVFTHPGLRRRVLVVGAGWAGRTIVRAIQENLSGDYELAGFVDDDPDKQGKDLEGVPVLCACCDLPSLARDVNVSEVIIAVTHAINSKLFESILACHEAGIQITPMSVLYEQMLGRVPVEHVGDNWFLVLPLSGNDALSLTTLVKRTVDVVVSLVGVTGFSLLLPLLALAIRLDSPGPVFYRQTRVGKAGRCFDLLKLRSMVPNAEGDGVARWACAGDRRITRVGKFLRKTRLDEMPQFLNILLGDMSLIGPRPERPEFVQDLSEKVPFYRARLAVRPGLTGWAQTRFTYGSSVEDAVVKLQYDLYYIKHQSLYLDLVIFLRTFGVVVALKGR